MPYAFDPDFAEAIELLPTSSVDFSDPAAIAAARSGPGLEALMADVPDRPGVRSQDLTVPGHDGDPEVPVRVYTPVRAGTSTRAGLLYIHGGGFMTGSVAMMDAACQAYCDELDAVVVSVEYRLAPEHPYPAGLHDCYAALVWLHDRHEQLGVDPARIGVGGGSAGGGLSAATALLARDLGGPPLCFQFLQIPELDDRLETASMRQFTDTPLWNRPNAEWSWTHYLGELHGRDDVPYTAAPSRCTDLSGLPPAYVSTMEFDPLRDEGILYALALLRDGVAVELHNYPGTFHGSSLIASAAVTKREAAESLEALRRGLAPR
jgi:acetyl esterase/lipase